MQSSILKKVSYYCGLLAFIGLVILGIIDMKTGANNTSSQNKPALSSDGFIGKVVDREGVASIKPVLNDRWSVANANMHLEPSDLIMTGVRGANAIKLQLVNGVQVIVGPATLLELVNPTNIKLIRGELEITAPEKVTVIVNNAKETFEVTGTKVLRVHNDKLNSLTNNPAWLVGYKNDKSTEAVGSLLANVDGRNVPLVMGYHKVTVDIRDQIARTEVEESFINTTSTILEGVFYFPLPQDASISGFAMWIGDEMVQAEIVEKQRAREIYETILRERRDPGLLEWTGGNIFKARVFPISYEKRIKITYTQVLSKTGNTYRYNYALQSEMLRLHPLKKLQLDVKISSTEAISKVESPSHSCRIDTTLQSAHIEFDAEEYSPSQDFELDVTTVPSQNNLTLINHQRGEDGYFMLLVNAPEQLENVSRKVLPNSSPTNFLIMADTSGSMSGTQRDKQIQFIEALLGSLGQQDTFNLVTCDVTTHQAFNQPVQSTLENREKAILFLEKRFALGWSDLNKAFSNVLGQIDKNTQVIYVGDGIVTTPNTDPAAFSKTLQAIYKGNGVFHAVATGSSYESGVLKSIASLGSGSVRFIGGGTDPAETAFELLKEISSPVVKSLSVKFSGIDVAAIYPETLPNLPAGTQQFIVGRYKPSTKNNKAKVSIFGSFNDQQIEYSLPIVLASEDAGNSFIPRLWARQHLDYLLSQGSNQQTKDKIITLSEDFQIITPYTSFLVLESDADRERFNVKKRFRMRDGEEFFATGRDNATFELTRKQMIKARGYRTELQSQMLSSLLDLNRSITPQLLNNQTEVLGFGSTHGFSRDSAALGGAVLPRSRSTGFGKGGQLEQEKFEGKDALKETTSEFGQIANNKNELQAQSLNDEIVDNELDDAKQLTDKDFDANSKPDIPSERDDILEVKKAKTPASAPPPPPPSQSSALRAFERAKLNPATIDARRVSELPINSRDFSTLSLLVPNRTPYGIVDALRSTKTPGYYGSESGYYNNFNPLFPSINEPRNQDIKIDWPKDVLQIAETLNRRNIINKSENGIQIKVESEYKDVRDRVTKSFAELLLSKTDWLTVGSYIPGNDFVIDWNINNERGALTIGWFLGRSRPSIKGDEASWNEPFAWYFDTSIKSYYSYKAELIKLEANKVAIVLSYPNSNNDYSCKLIIDTTKSVILEQLNFNKDKITSKTVYSDFIEVEGGWWPQLITSQDGDGKVTGKTKISLQTLPKTQFDELIAKKLEIKKDAIILDKTIENIQEAKQNVKNNQAKLADYWSLLSYFAASQQWDKAKLQLDGIARLTATKRGFNLIQLAFLQASRRNEELKNFLTKLATELATKPREADYAIANQLLNYTYSLNAGNERLQILNILKPVYERQKHIVGAFLQWDQSVIQALQNMARPEELFAKQAQMTKDYPFNYDIHTNYANALANRGEIDIATKYLSEIAIKNAPWQDYELQQFRSTISSILLNAQRLKEFVEYIEIWLKEGTNTIDQYVLNQYLSSLIMLDQETKANQIIKNWLISNRKERLEPIEINKLGAAIQMALGQGYNFYTQRIDPQYIPLLVDTARYFANHTTNSTYTVSQIMQNYNFIRTDAGLALQKEFYQQLQQDSTKIQAEQLQQYFSWLRAYNFAPEEGESSWQKILDQIFLRWQKETKETDKQILGNLITTYGRTELKLNYYRIELSNANTPETKASATYKLFYALLAEKWSTAVENELVQLLPSLEPTLGKDPQSTKIYLDLLIVAFHNFASWSVEARSTASVAALPNINLKTRQELKIATQQAQLDARLATLQLLLKLEKEFNPSELRPWINIERLYLEVKLKRNPEEIRSTALALLLPITNNSINKETDNILIHDHVLAVRAVSTLIYLALLQKDNKTNIQDLLNIFDSAINEKNKLLDWKGAKYQLLVLLDRGDDVEATLNLWFSEQDDLSRIRWGRDYAYILAERNQISKAIKVFEQIEKEDELYFADYRTLADWYLVENGPEKVKEAKIKSWQAANENTIYNELNNELYKYRRQRTEVPSELDPEVPIKLIALLRKAQYPANYIYIVNQYYETTKDFRILECIPEAMIGQSAQKIYPLLNQFSSISNMIQEEATIDRLEKHLQTLQAKTKSSVDRRALHLLEFMAEQRATKQTQGIKQHVDLSLRALREAYKGQWVDGEAELMAQFLSSQGQLNPEVLANEQIRQLKELYLQAKLGSYPRLVIGGYFATGQWANSRQLDAINTLKTAIAEYRQANGGILPQSANTQLSTYCSYLESTKNYIEAESVWLKELSFNPNAQQTYWLKQQLYRSYYNAISNQATVSLGSGEELYKAVHKRLLGELEEYTNESQAYTYVQILCDIWYSTDKNLHYISPKADLVNFAFEKLPQILNKYNYRNGQSIVSSVSYRLRDNISALSGLEFLIERAENEPSWLQLQNQDFWANHSSYLAQYRSEAAGKTAKLDERLLKLVLKELRNDLETRTRRAYNIYYQDSSYFWKEKKTDFARTAQEVLLKNSKSEETVIYTSDYLYNGLKLYEEAIKALLTIYYQDRLGIEGQYKLCYFLQEQNRYTESVPILVKMCEVKPERLEFRTMLMKGYFHTNKPDLLAKTLATTDKYFHENERWQENVIATLAKACLETKLYTESSAYHKEAIALHVKTAPNRGVGDGILSQYYRSLSEAYSGLSLTSEAVDAAAGAIISWGQNQQNRQYELAQLENVLRQAKDLDSYVQKLSEEVKKSGLENPIIRKALGKVFYEKGQLKKAETQLISVIETQPNDKESHTLLVKVYDGQGKFNEATNQILAFTKLDSYNLTLYQDLGKRWAKAEKTEDAERAFTNMVEMMPNESESHEALAKLRQEQNRWEEAVLEWNHVIRIRTKEPTGYLGLAQALIHLKRSAEAKKVINTLSQTDWPKHFGNVKSQANELNRLNSTGVTLD